MRVDAQYLSVLDRVLTHELCNAEYIFHFTHGGNENVHEEVRRVFDAHGVEPKRRGLITRAGNVGIDGQSCPLRLKGTLQACRRFYVNVLLPNGEVVLCCMDWGLKHILGNLLECRYEDLHQGEAFRLILRGQRDAGADTLCRTCEEARCRPTSGARLRRAVGRLLRRPRYAESEPDILE
ncbi:MAG: SPASM domain-containing protein [Phycisphaerae bacterium]|nr:SPASM domain-containing protein [Phycisphaerae bacterium]